MRLEVLMAVTIKTMDSYDVTPCSFTAGHQNFGGISDLLSSGKIYRIFSDLIRTLFTVSEG